MKFPSRLSPGVMMNCEILGEGEVPVLFLHGFAASSVTWEELAPFFPTEKYRLYLLDLKGSGKSSKPCDKAYRPEDQALLVLEVIEGLGIRNVILAGHSLGGGIALLACHKAMETGRTSLIARLVLIDAATYPQPFPRFFRWLRAIILGRMLLTLIPLRTMVKYNLEKVYRNPGQITETRITRYVSCFKGKGTVSAIIATARQVDSISKTPDHTKISIPTLIIWGEHDRVVRFDNGKRLHAEVPGSRLVVFDCGHNPHEEEASECAAAILAFIEET